MWPFRKKTDATPKTSKAIAYLKAAVTDDDGKPAIELPHADTPVLKGLNDELLIAYVVDAGDAFEYVQYRDLEDDAVTETQLHDIAIQNLAALTQTGNLRVSPHGNIFAVLLDGNFEASMILLDVLWDDAFRQFVDGEYLIAIPNRDILAFCDRSSVAGRRELMEVIARLEGSQDHPLTRRLYVRMGSQWKRENEA